MRWQSASLAACSCVLLAACGDRAPVPGLPLAFASGVERVSQLLEADRPCAAATAASQLRGQAIRELNRRRIPPRYQEDLLARVNTLVESSACRPGTDAAVARGRALSLLDWLASRTDWLSG